MWTHYMNENEHMGKKGWPRKGRYFIHLDENGRKSISFEWSLFSPMCAVGFDIGDEDWTFKIAIPFLFAFWLSFEGFKFLDKIAPRRKCIAIWDNNREFELIDERECEIRVHDWAIWVSPWGKSGEWNSRDPWWVKGLTFHIDDFILGRREYKKEIIQESQPILIPMPEGCYEAEFKVTKNSWWRSRLPMLKKIRYFADIEIPKGVPYNGKGENSWDCGTDGIFGTSVEIQRLSEAAPKAIAKIVECAMEGRYKYGTPDDTELKKWREEKIAE